jgi:hypothetical protein
MSNDSAIEARMSAPDFWDHRERPRRDKSFKFVASGPLVCSSCHAADFNPLKR